MDIRDRRMTILVVVQMQVPHGERGEAHGARGLSALLHVARDGEELAGGERAARRRAAHRRARRLERARRALAHRQRAQRAPGRVLGGALQGQRPGAGAELLLLLEGEAQAQRGRVRHRGRRHWARRLRWREQFIPVLHDGKKCIKT